jgi:hypothetical protein
VQHEALERFAGLQQFDALFVVLGAQRGGNQRLRFAAGKDSRSVGTRQRADFAPDRADFVERAAIGTAARFQHLIAEDPLLEKLENLVGFVFLLFGGFFDRRSCSASTRA